MARADLERLVAANAPLWGGEGEVIRAYFDWPGRSEDTDRAWLFHQAYKEYWDGYAPHARRVAARWEEAGAGWPVRDALEALEVAAEELEHFEAFAGLYDRLRRPGEPPLDPRRLRADGNWPENEALGKLRAAHREAHGQVGVRAQWFTEGGYSALYRVAGRLAGRGGLDEAIAAACGPIYEDEVGHMLAGVAGLEEADLAPSEWDLLVELTTAQCRQRIRMRDAQFGHSLPRDRLEVLLAGGGTPEPFDWERVPR